jgi:hemolysin activation/secretion protein
LIPLIAQLIAPPLQPGPVRLPASAPTEQRWPLPQDRNESEKPTFQGSPPEQAPALLPKVEGSRLYGPKQLRQIFAGCGRPTQADSLLACAAALNARLEADGYINTRVYVLSSPPPGALEVVEGRLAEIRVIATNPRQAARVRRLLRPLQGTVLNVPALERQIQVLRRRTGLDLVQGSIGRLGSDTSQGTLTLSVAGTKDPLRGDLSLRNDGNAGYGEWRAVATLLQNNLLHEDDLLLVYGEGDMDDTPKLGAVITSLSYLYPLSESLSLTGSSGYSRRNLVEGPQRQKQIAFRQFQSYGQLEWVFHESLWQRLALFGGISFNRNDAYSNGQLVPLLFGSNRTTNTGYLRFGVGASGVGHRSSWNASIYGLQGGNGFSPQEQLNNMGKLGIVPSQASAIGASVALAAGLSANTSILLRGGGQIALNPLIPDMGFTVGSDTGIRGLPGQTLSGDSGYLGSVEIAWSIWRRQSTTLQLVPFFGYGGVNSVRSFQSKPIIFNNGIGAGGVMARLLAGAHWQVELGWVRQFNHFDQADDAIWGDSFLLGSGLYSQLKLRF